VTVRQSTRSRSLTTPPAGRLTAVWRPGVKRALVAAGAGAGTVAVVVVSLLVGFGWLYVLRDLGWFTVGAQVHDSLPLLQLAAFDGQAALRVVVAWLLTGALAGLALIRIRPWLRAVTAGPLALALLLLLSQAAFALTRNLRFSDVVFSRRPGFGSVLEGLAFAVGCALPRRLRADHRRRRGLGPLLVIGAGEPSLGAGEHRYAAEHQGDRGRVPQHRGRSGAK